MTPVRELCEVLERRRVGAYHALTLLAPRIAGQARPGQFVHLLAGEDRSFPLRRPFSIHRAERPGGSGGPPGWSPGGMGGSGGPGPALGTVEVVFDVVGAGTGALSRLRPHDVVDALGPLGRPFTPPETPTGCVLVGGGYGTAPLYFLATELRLRRCRVDFVIGAASAGRLLDAMEAKRLGHSLTLTTDDGSAGRRGLVTDPLGDLLPRTGAGQVYACGPMPMLAAVSRAAAAAGVPCQVAVEEQMACGTGICFSCVLPVGPGAPTRMARSCLEGPVFDGAAIAWAELGFPELEPTA
ncbi:MAG TPA: dihydroorotate dehydrogenase electron transfer subunit [Actinomycetota bacterium]|jgi:dihydroorotate dehydrogenase electron transfer subunit